MSRIKSAFWGTLSSQLYTIILVLLNLISVPIILKHLSSEIYGLSILIFQMTSYLGLFDFGLTAGVERFLAGAKDDTDENRLLVQKVISTSFIVYTIIAILVVVSGNILALFAGEIIKVPETYNVKSIISVITCIIGLQIILRSISSIFFAHQRQMLSNTLSFIMNLSNTAFILIFILRGCGIFSFVYSQVVVFFITAILNIYFFRKYYPYIKFRRSHFDYQLLKKMFSYGISLFLISMATQIIFQTDRVIVGSFVSLMAVSIYSITTRVPELVTQILWRITDNAFPGIVEVLKTDGSSFKRVHDNLMNITMILSTAAFWGVIIALEPFIKLWVGESQYAGLNFLLLAAYLYFIQHTFIHVTSMCLSAAGVVKKISVIYITEAIINIAISFFLVTKYRLIGVVCGTIIAGLLTSVWFTPAIAIKHMGSTVGSYVLSIMKPVFTTSIVGGGLYLLLNKTFANINSWISLVLYSVIFGGMLLTGIYCFNRVFIKELICTFRKK